MEKRRIVVTGLGCVSPVGNNVKDTWESVKNGRCGVGKATLFDTTNQSVKIAAEVKGFSLKDSGVDEEFAAKLPRYSQFLLASSIEAVKDSGFSKESFKGQKAGVCVGNSMFAMDEVEDAYKKVIPDDSLNSQIDEIVALKAVSNEVSLALTRYFGLRSPSCTMNTACASGADSIHVAAELIRSGRVDMCISGGAEAVINGFIIAIFAQLSALTKDFNDAPEKASRPFDKNRSGFVYGEGAAVLMLEEYEHAKARGARIYCELAGTGSSSDAYHITAPNESGEIPAVAFRKALEDSGLNPEDITYYNAHGTSTHANDAAETKMLKLVFGDHAKKLRISSTKSMTGHLVAGAGVIESLFCVKAIEEGFVPPTINLDDQDIEGGCDLDYTPKVGVKCDIKAAASGSLGFGGHNGVVIFKKI